MNIPYNKKIAPWFLLLPFLVLFLLFKAFPVLYAAYLSLHNITGFTVGAFAGLKNYLNVLKDPNFRLAFLNNTKYMLGTLITLVPVPMFLAILLESRYCKGKKVYKTMMFLPALTSLVVAASIFRIMLYEGSSGLVNSILKVFGMKPIGWLSDPRWTLISVVIIATWRWMGMDIVYYSTGLTNIPKEMYEAAAVDGANSFQRTWYITIPLLRPVIVFVLTLNALGGYQLFTEPYILWDGGVSPANSALTLAVLLYRKAFTHFDLGYASALGFLMAIIIMAISVIQFKLVGFFDD